MKEAQVANVFFYSIGVGRRDVVVGTVAGL